MSREEEARRLAARRRGFKDGLEGKPRASEDASYRESYRRGKEQREATRRRNERA